MIKILKGQKQIYSLPKTKDKIKKISIYIKKTMIYTLDEIVDFYIKNKKGLFKGEDH